MARIAHLKLLECEDEELLNLKRIVPTFLPSLRNGCPRSPGRSASATSCPGVRLVDTQSYLDLSEQTVQ